MPTLSCDDRGLRMEPGTCAELTNLCNDTGMWAGPPDFDGLRYEPTEDAEALFGANVPFSVHTRRIGDVTSRSLCVRSDSPFFQNLDVDLLYGVGPKYGISRIYLTVGPPPVTVAVRAERPHIAAGENTFLVATPSNGVPPYFYHWIPRSSLNDDDIAAPIASPTVTTEYTVIVTDSFGEQASNRVTVSVDNDLLVTANPAEISLGEGSVLIATPLGGTPPYDMIWTPADTLDDPYVREPLAAPLTTTTYRVIVFDALGAVTSGSATVKVRMALDATAEPHNVLPGGTSRLFADVRGGSPPYTFTWTPADRLDDPNRQDPVAAPATATTYNVVARDAAGDAVGGAVTVQVISDAPPPTASFIWSIDCCPRMELDASASTGQIASYTWDLGWTSANPDRITTSPTTSFAIREFDRGPITLTVTATDGQTATFTLVF